MNLCHSICLFVAATLLLSSCAHKEVEKLREETAHLLQENQSFKSNVATLKKEKETLTLRIDTLSEQLTNLAKFTPREFKGSMDSLQRLVVHLENRLSSYQTRNQQISDSIEILKQKIRALYALPGNRALRLTQNTATYDCYVVDTRQSDIQFYWRDAKNKPLCSLRNLSQMITNEQKTIVFSTNGGMYTPANAPQGLFIQNGMVLVPVDRKKEEKGNFYMQPNGIFLIDGSNEAKILSTDDYDDRMKVNIKFATQSGPMLVVNGQINTKFQPQSTSFYVRSGVGIIDSTHVVFIISNQAVNFFDFASIFLNKEFQCANALYLDGAISQMYLPELGRFEEDGGHFGPIIGITKK